MKTTITYGNGWFRFKRRLAEIWDEKHAKQSHEKRQPYAVLIEEDSKLSCFVEINNDYVGVGFFDSSGREYLSYAFQELKPGRLFLSMATHREFERDSEKSKAGTTYYFKQDGSVKIEKEDFIANTHSVKETKADVSSNWEPYPAFGRYEGITRENR